MTLALTAFYISGQAQEVAEAQKNFTQFVGKWIYESAKQYRRPKGSK